MVKNTNSKQFSFYSLAVSTDLMSQSACEVHHLISIGTRTRAIAWQSIVGMSMLETFVTWVVLFAVRSRRRHLVGSNLTLLLLLLLLLGYAAACVVVVWCCCVMLL